MEGMGYLDAVGMVVYMVACMVIRSRRSDCSGLRLTFVYCLKVGCGFEFVVEIPLLVSLDDHRWKKPALELIVQFSFYNTRLIDINGSV